MAAVAVHFDTLEAGVAEVARLALLLDPAERERASRFRFDRDRRRFVVRRAKLRLLLAERAGRAPEALAYAASSHGKPALPGAGFCFSLSHSGERMMLAIAEGEVGCDIEAVDETIDWREIADGLFAAAERDALAALPEAEGRRAFFECWARKEAFVKALGLGLSYPLDAFHVSVTPEARLLRGGEGWMIAATDALLGHAAAVVARDDGMPLEIGPVRTGWLD